ncbi:hypothetical protein T01_10288 [Trichinella spiralis]|uniref:Uncharacterized protein n=1 Tax=Trichinella spiralis TaxID=6334 RepID=A0A0V1BV87_TRISP|nr:hypothetical protein T01_10288 [Trichinella spiralis]
MKFYCKKFLLLLRHRHVANLEHSLHFLRVYVISGQWLVWSFATSLERSVGRLPNRLDVMGAVGEDAREWLLEIHETQGLTNLASEA